MSIERSLRSRSSLTRDPLKKLGYNDTTVYERSSETFVKASTSLASYSALFEQSEVWNSTVVQSNLKNEELEANGNGHGKFYHSKNDKGGSSDEDSPWQNGRFKSANEIVDHYKKLGDWWNHLPKTDITYEPTSKWYRREIAPGIPMIPNLARPPLHPVPPKSQFGWFTREKKVERSSRNGGYDEVSSSASTVIQQKSWFWRVLSYVTAIFTKVWCFVTLSQQESQFQAQPLTGRRSAEADAAAVWWKAPFHWFYRLMMMLFTLDVLVLISIQRAFSVLLSKTALKIFTLLLLLLAVPFVSFTFGYTSNTMFDNIDIYNLTSFNNWQTILYSPFKYSTELFGKINF